MTSTSSISKLARIAALVAVAALSLACEPAGGLVAGSGSGEAGTTSGATTGDGGQAAGPGGTEPTSAGTGKTSAGPGPTPVGTEETTAATDIRPVVGNVEMSAGNVQCSYVPNGNLDGSDGLTVFTYVLLIGANSLPGTLSNRMTISNGFSTNYTGRPNNQAAAVFQGPIRSSDWGSGLTVTITADTDDRFRETDESDNTIEVEIDLPGNRPSQPMDPLPCTATRA